MIGAIGRMLRSCMSPADGSGGVVSAGAALSTEPAGEGAPGSVSAITRCGLTVMVAPMHTKARMPTNADDKSFIVILPFW